MAGYDRNKEKSEKIESVNVEKEKGERYLNLEAYSYDGGQWKLRIRPVNKNTNPNAPDNKKWIQQKSISAITVDEAKGLVKALEKGIAKIKNK